MSTFQTVFLFVTFFLYTLCIFFLIIPPTIVMCAFSSWQGRVYVQYMWYSISNLNVVFYALLNWVQLFFK